MSLGQSKGGGIINSIAVMRDRMGEPQFKDMVATLPGPTQALVNRRILAVEWVPIADWEPVPSKYLSSFCGGSEDGLVDMARESCRRDFNTLYRFFLRVLSPSYVLARTAQIFHTYTDMGRLEIVNQRRDDGREKLLMRLSNYYPAPIFAMTTHGYIFEILTLAKANDLTVERTNTNVANGRLGCDYHISFSA